MNITDLNEIDSSTKEGQYLMAAMAFITTTNRTDKTPYQVLDELGALRAVMFPEQDSRHLNPPMPEMPIMNWKEEGVLTETACHCDNGFVGIGNTITYCEVCHGQGSYYVKTIDTRKNFINGDDRLL